MKYDRLDINVGDIIFFDSRIFHRATPIDPNNEIKINFEENNNYVKDLDEPSCKYALYYQFGNEKGFNSYWYDRSKRTDSIKEKEEWAQTKQLIKKSICPSVCSQLREILILSLPLGTVGYLIAEIRIPFLYKYSCISNNLSTLLIITDLIGVRS